MEQTVSKLRTDAEARTESIDLPDYFDMQAELGHTKHLGGQAATRELVARCNIGPDSLVLNVGSGAGLSTVYLVELTGCHVVGVDLNPKMVERARRWAHKRGVTDKTYFKVADAQHLPFDDNIFDALICESVNTFVPDRARAARQYARVVKPGGHIGLNEAIWLHKPPESVAGAMSELTKRTIETSEVWMSMMQAGGLRDITETTHGLDMRTESKNQVGYLSVWEYIGMLGSFFKLFLFTPQTRQYMKLAAREPRQMFDHMGYGLYTGRVPG